MTAMIIGQSSIHGFGLIAKEFIPAGTVLGYSYENGGLSKDRIYGGLKMVLPFDML